MEVTPQGISVRHMDRLLGGLLLATSPRVDWARLLRRTFGFDVLACAGCQGRIRLMSAITEPAVVRRILEHLGIPATAPPVCTGGPWAGAGRARAEIAVLVGEFNLE
jgi:hypothetical protein